MLRITKLVYIAVLLVLVGTGHLFAQKTFDSHIVKDPKTLEKLKKAVEKNPDSLSFHQNFIKALGLNNPGLDKQYEIWMAQFPKLAMVPYALGKAYEDVESPKAKPYLLKAVALDAKLTEAWGGLWIDAERWGDFEGGRKYLAKAVASDPSNPDYSFYYASSFHGIDEAKYKKMSLAVANKFPNHVRGAQAIYWLGARSKEVADKLYFFSLLRDRYDPSKFNWSASGMYSFYEVLLTSAPQKAVVLAEEMMKGEKSGKEWPSLKIQAEHITTARALMSQNKPVDALTALNQVKFPRQHRFNKELLLLKAQAIHMAGNTSAAYDSLLIAFAKDPGVKLKKALKTFGAQLRKGDKDITADFWKYVDANAKSATAFSLKQYAEKEECSLADYKGKVILLTYWFPGCGPCRGEFPHFENVLRKFKREDLAYLGINIVSEQNDYVVTFMKTSGYSFTPLEDVKGRVKGNLDNRGAAPANFLIDAEGRLIFSGFRTDGNNEQDLELMIQLLLEHKVQN